ncbi:MAG: hypothetical protein WCA00_16555 [Candidatus Acidiferrales bacterium]
MSDGESAQEDAETKKAEAKRQKQELIQKRTKQLEDWQRAVVAVETEVRANKKRAASCRKLIDHATGLYEEVNKLVKKSALPATPLIRDSANDIISDAKSLVKAKVDVHLDRVKEFVPAGDEPSYPDVLVVLRSVIDSLKRHRSALSTEAEVLSEQTNMAGTMVAGLKYFLLDPAKTSEKETPSKESVRSYATVTLSDFCFTRYSDSTEKYFDFDGLDSMGVEEHLARVTDAEDSGDFEEDDDKGEEEDDEEDA